LPFAVLGIDLGINRAACTTLLLPTRVSETRYFVQKDKVAIMESYDKQVAELQHKLDILRNQGTRYDRVKTKLRKISSKRENVSKEYDKVLIKDLIDYIIKLDEKYTVYVAIGQLKGIRWKARKGDGQGRKLRGRMHRWTFSRITRFLKHGLTQLGWKVEGKGARFHTIPEAWTSILCWKCGRKGIRPKQSLFICPTCGFRTNADRNGSLNIARRLIKLIPLLQNEKGLGRWVLPERAPASKASRTKQSKKKSSLHSKGQTSDLVEPAAIRTIQMDLLSFGDNSEMSDDDLAVVKTVESSSATGTDATREQQGEETRTAGGIVSQ
jgi:transposase